MHGFKDPLHDWRWSVAWFVMAAGLGALMTSTVRYYSFKDIPWTRKQPSLAIVLLCMTVALVWLYSEYVLILFWLCTYAAVGVVAARGAAVATPAGFADCLMHPSLDATLPSNRYCGSLVAVRRGVENAAGRKPFCRRGFFSGGRAGRGGHADRSRR